MAPPSRGSENGFPNPKLDREGSGRHDNKTNLVRSSSGGLGGAGVVLKMARVIKDGSARGQRYAADVVKKHETVIIPARELVEVFAKDEKSSSYIFDDTDPSANIQTNNVSQPASDGSSNKPFSVGENRLEKLSKDSNENLGKRNVQPENNLSGGGRPLVAEGLDGPPSISHAYESSAPETLDSTISVKHPSAVEPVTSSQRPGSSASSTSERIAANSFASAPGLSPSTPIGSLTSEKSTMNPNAKEFKLNPNAKSFTPLASLRPLHPPASDTSYYYPNNMPAAPLGTGLPVGMGEMQQ
ncbi:hypothetical protein C2845_PM03G26330 [Panicum miliaceum]|uniref:Uncharacterized protein n=1 Tax=Panicum miliaceum TaxID=4540 RepID=A0A3L6T822_PANMI|nr:hypothetical protein C2845_PM03G26330 [Panicum miliaceum]